MLLLLLLLLRALLLREDAGWLLLALADPTTSPDCSLPYLGLHELHGLHGPSLTAPGLSFSHSLPSLLLALSCPIPCPSCSSPYLATTP